MKEDIYRLFGLSIYREEMNESMRQLQQKEKISTLHGDTAKPPLKKKNQSLLNSTKIHDNRLRMTGSGQKIKEPLFNFVNSPSVSSCCSKTSPLKTNYSPSFPPTSSHGVATSVHDMFERIVYEAIAENATSLSCSNDPTDDNSMSSNSFSQEEKMAKIWSALLRHSEAGRFHQMAQEVSHGTSIKYTPPNPICTSLCLQIVQNALRLAGMPSFLLNMLIGGLSNSIYAKYDPSRSFQEHTQYATLGKLGSSSTVANAIL
jgi:hypothetical protein